MKQFIIVPGVTGVTMPALLSYLTYTTGNAPVRTLSCVLFTVTHLASTRGYR